MFGNRQLLHLSGWPLTMKTGKSGKSQGQIFMMKKSGKSRGNS